MANDDVRSGRTFQGGPGFITARERQGGKGEGLRQRGQVTALFRQHEQHPATPIKGVRLDPENHVGTQRNEPLSRAAGILRWIGGEGVIHLKVETTIRIGVALLGGVREDPWAVGSVLQQVDGGQRLKRGPDAKAKNQGP